MPIKVYPSMVLHVPGLSAPFHDIDWRQYPPGWEMGYVHSHRFYQIVYVVKGATMLRLEKELNTSAGEYVILAPGKDHTWFNTSGKTAQMLNINMREAVPGFTEITRALDSVSGLADGACTGNDRTFVKTASKVLNEVKQGLFGYKYRITALLMEFLLGALRRSLADAGDQVAVRSATRLDRVVWYMEQHLARKLTLEDIAKQAGVSAKHTCDLFKEELGIAPVQYLNRIRVERARLLLEDPSMRVNEIALAVGIEDEHYFSRLFKKHTGITPSQYRAQLAGGR